MKLFHISLMLFIALLLNGCIGDDMDGCFSTEDGNLTIKFRYEDQTGTDIFTHKIHKVDLFVFDDNGYFIANKCIEQASLSIFAGTKINLQPGNYRIVCWGNISGNTSICHLDTQSILDDAFIENIAIQNGSNIATGGDALYYAPEPASTSLPQEFRITVPQQGTTEHTIGFYDSHISIQVFVKGLEDKDQNGKNLAPVIELTNISSRYDFGMQTFGTEISYSNTSVHQTQNGEELAVKAYFTPRFKNDNPIQVLIKKASNNTTQAVIDLKEFMIQNNITVEGIRQVEIPILIEFTNASVEITVPNWSNEPIIPEL